MCWARLLLWQIVIGGHLTFPHTNPVIKEKRTTGNVRPQKQCSHKHERERESTHTHARMHTHVSESYPLARRASGSTGESTTIWVYVVTWCTSLLLSLQRIYTHTCIDVGKKKEHAFAYQKVCFVNSPLKSRTSISTISIQPAAVVYTNKYSLRKQAIIVHFYYRSCTLLTCLMMQVFFLNGRPLSYLVFFQIIWFVWTL